MGMVRRKLELELMVMKRIIVLVLAVVIRAMHAFVWNSRWWGEFVFHLIQERTATMAAGKANIASSNRHRDAPVRNYFVEKFRTHNITLKHETKNGYRDRKPKRCKL